jgi:hypothetical protein
MHVSMRTTKFQSSIPLFLLGGCQNYPIRTNHTFVANVCDRVIDSIEQITVQRRIFVKNGMFKLVTVDKGVTYYSVRRYQREVVLCQTVNCGLFRFEPIHVFVQSFILLKGVLVRNDSRSDTRRNSCDYTDW